MIAEKKFGEVRTSSQFCGRGRYREYSTEYQEQGFLSRQTRWLGTEFLQNLTWRTGHAGIPYAARRDSSCVWLLLAIRY
jgi:hypothetical protein